MIERKVVGYSHRFLLNRRGTFQDKPLDDSGKGNCRDPDNVRCDTTDFVWCQAPANCADSQRYRPACESR